MNYSDQIAAFESRRDTNKAALEDIAKAAAEDGATLDAQQKEQKDDLLAEIKEIDDHLKFLRDMEAISKAKAAPAAGESSEKASDSRGGEQVFAKAQKKLAPGHEFARLAKVRAVSRLDGDRPIDVAKAMYGEDSNVFGIIKATVAPGTTVSGNWAADLVSAEGGPFADFVEFLRPATILGKFGTNGIPALRSVPHNRRLVEQTGGGAGYWVGEAKPKPLTAFDFNGTTLPLLKVANIAVLSEEIIRDSSPSAEAIVRDSLRDALAARLDTDFIDPLKAIAAGVSPASITNGAAAIAAGSTGDADDVRLDVRSLIAKFIAANNTISGTVFIMSENNAVALSLLTNALGQPEFPTMNMGGGTLMGIPVITSEYAESNVVLAKASDIYLVDDSGVTVDMSREASLEMLDGSLTQAPPTGAALVSMFQNNLVALRAERSINWSRRRASAVAYLTSVAWGGAVNAS